MAKALVAVVVFFAAIFGAFVLLAGLVSAINTPRTDEDELATSHVEGDRGNERQLLIIPVTGLILGEKEGAGSLFSTTAVTYGYDVQHELAQAADDPSIKGVILELDTPGGTIYGSRAIADGVADYQSRTGRPVLAWVRGMAASGGMYAMSGADEIMADHGTLIGSIGVIFGPFTHYEGVVGTDGGLLGGGIQTTGGITEEYITAGKGKDLGNPYRKMTDEERANLQQGVDNSYREFVGAVAAGRDISASTIVEQLGAMIYDEATAVQKGLVDEIGNRGAAYGKAAELAGLRAGDYDIVRVDRNTSGLAALLGAKLGLRSTPERPCVQGAQLLAIQGEPPLVCS